MSNILSTYTFPAGEMAEVGKPRDPSNKHETRDRGKRYTVMNTKTIPSGSLRSLLTVIVSR
jgi:hypothetical protein